MRVGKDGAIGYNLNRFVELMLGVHLNYFHILLKILMLLE
jgi:hypothetical protein